MKNDRFATPLLQLKNRQHELLKTQYGQLTLPKLIMYYSKHEIGLVDNKSVEICCNQHRLHFEQYSKLKL